MAGAGVFGGYHATKVAAAEGVVLMAVYDADASRAAALAEVHGIEARADLASFLEGLDAVIVATPATAHAQVAGAALASSAHVLVEKPIALTIEEADTLIGAAAARDLVLQVGHQERYVAEALGLLDRTGIRHVRSRRRNVPSGRAGDVSVVMDLMIHDLDLLAKLAGSDAAYVTRCEARQRNDGPVDFVDVDLRVGSLTAQLVASRVDDRTVRDIVLVTADGRIGLDFVSREVTNETETPLAAALGEGAALSDPLGYGLTLFLDAIRGGPAPKVTGADGRAALRLALTIEEAVKEVL